MQWAVNQILGPQAAEETFGGKLLWHEYVIFRSICSLL